MNTVFLPPDAIESGKHMKSLSTSLPAQQMIVPGSAANADQLADRARVPAAGHVDAPHGGWDSYEVWRRFIKDARDRRQPQE
jgi:hypothetical protein